jgi:hypothetical protein
MLLFALQIVHPATQDNADRLRKLWNLLGHLKQTCKNLYQPNPNVAIDERMVKSNGEDSSSI